MEELPSRSLPGLRKIRLGRQQQLQQERDDAHSRLIEVEIIRVEAETKKIKLECEKLEIEKDKLKVEKELLLLKKQILLQQHPEIHTYDNDGIGPVFTQL